MTVCWSVPHRYGYSAEADQALDALNPRRRLDLPASLLAESVSRERILDAGRTLDPGRTLGQGRRL